jgi:hypothetical protein
MRGTIEETTWRPLDASVMRSDGKPAGTMRGSWWKTACVGRLVFGGEITVPACTE